MTGDSCDVEAFNTEKTRRLGETRRRTQECNVKKPIIFNSMPTYSSAKDFEITAPVTYRDFGLMKTMWPGQTFCDATTWGNIAGTICLASIHGLVDSICGHDGTEAFGGNNQMF